MLTFDDCQTTCQDLTSDTSSASLTFFNRFMNIGYKFLLAELGRSVTEKTKTALTVASQQYYQMPPDFLWLKELTITVGSTIYPVQEIVDQEEWDYLNTTSQKSDLPTFLFVRPSWGVGGAEIGIYPIPSSNGNTITLVYEASDRDLSQPAYTTGTVAVTNGSDAVVGTGTAFIAAMVGRYFQITSASGDGLWYKVDTRTDNTHITLENYYQGDSGSGLNYKIAEAFALPEEIQILPCYYAIGHYYHMKQDFKKALIYLGDGSPADRSLFTTGLRAAKARYGTKSRSNIIRKNPWWVSTGESYPRWFPESITG